MKILKICISTLIALVFSTAMTQAVQFLSFSTVAGATMQFNGNASSFQFDNNGSGNQWWITGEGGGSGALALQGSFSGGPWTYGGITINGLDQSATVDPSSTVLTINDGSGHLATANVVWGVLSTDQGVGGINANLSVNLSELSYLGANSDLLSVFSATTGILDLSFQFNPAMTLSQLSAGSGPYATSFSGTLAPTPEPASLLVFGVGGIALLGRRILRRRVATAVA